jgi:hypothetical protein
MAPPAARACGGAQGGCEVKRPALLLALAAALPFAPALHAAHPAVSGEMAGVWLPDSKRSDRAPRVPLRPEAAESREKWLAEYGPVDQRIDDTNASCIAEPMPWPARLIAQYPFELLFTPERVTVFYEVFGSLRRIPIGTPRNTFDSLPSAMGTSSGRWEGDTLVVETHTIRRDGAGKPTGDAPISNARRIIERFSMGKDEAGNKQLRNELTIVDPVVLTAPVKFTMRYKWSPDIFVGEYLCQQDIWDQNLQGSPSTVPWRK